MADILVVGSGASGVHFALTALQRGHAVTLVDVGYQRPPPVLPENTVEELRDRLEDPVSYFLGPDGAGVVFPGSASSYYGHPPSKGYVFRVPPGVRQRAEAMTPLYTFARGGFAEAWTAGCYAFSPEDFAGFPITYEDLRGPYQEVARRIGVCGERDDLEPFIPFDAEYLPPLPLDPHSATLVRRYERKREVMRHHDGFYLGRSRVATLSQAHGDRAGCTQLGRCLWGCPHQALYAPSVTLRECLQHPAFVYEPGLLVSHFDADAQGVIRTVQAQGVDGGAQRRTFRPDLVVLAAGTLGSTRIVLASLASRGATVPTAGGLMDNRQIHMPFLTPGMVGHPVDLSSYQFHHLAFTVRRADPRDHVHGQITTLKAAAIHPIVSSLPMDLRSGLSSFQALRPALGIANVNLPDTRRDASRVTVEPATGGGMEFVIRYAPEADEPAQIRAAARQVRRALRRLGAYVPPGLTRVLPKGASVHYSGTLPMSTAAAPLTVSAACRSHDFSNLFVVDGSVFPRLPAKNLTFTLMANAVRVASSL